MANRIQLRRDTTLNWENTNPVLADGEPGYDINTNEVRVGDGSTSWTGLSGNVIGTGGGGGGGPVSSLTNGSAVASLGSNGTLTMPVSTSNVMIDATTVGTQTIAQNGTVTFSQFSGEILVNAIDSGSMYKYLVGGGKVWIMGSTSPNWTPSSGAPTTYAEITATANIEFVGGSSTYVFTNLSSSDTNFNIVAIKTRNNSQAQLRNYKRV